MEQWHRRIEVKKMFRLAFWTLFLALAGAFLKGANPYNAVIIGGTIGFCIGIMALKSKQAKK